MKLRISLDVDLDNLFELDNGLPLPYLMGVATNCLTHLLDSLTSLESSSSCRSGALEVEYQI